MKITYRTNISGLSLDGYKFTKNSEFRIDSQDESNKYCILEAGFGSHSHISDLYEGYSFTLTNKRFEDVLSTNKISRYVDGVIDNVIKSETYSIF